MNKLLATGNAYLVEANPDDKVWGIGMDRYDKYARAPGYWKGDNLLGQILMDVRGLSRISISK